MKDFVEDIMGVVMPRKPKPRPDPQPTQAPHGFGLQEYAQPQQQQIQPPPDYQSTTRKAASQRHVENYPTAGSPQYENVEVLAAKPLNQFDMRGVKRDYEERMYELNDKISGRARQKHSPTVSGAHIPQVQGSEMAQLDEEDRKLEGTMESRLWYLADAYSVHTPEGRMKLFDLVESLFKFIKVNNIYGIIEYVKVVIPKMLELITVHVKLFEDYEQREQINRARMQLLNGLVEDYFGHIARLEEENQELKREMFWEYKYRDLRKKYELRFGEEGEEGESLSDEEVDEHAAGMAEEEKAKGRGNEEGTPASLRQSRAGPRARDRQPGQRMADSPKRPLTPAERPYISPAIRKNLGTQKPYNEDDVDVSDLGEVESDGQS